MSWDPEATAAYWINRTSRALVRRFDGCLRPFGFAMSYFPVLRVLGDGRAHTQTALAQAAGVELPSMAETLARMQRDGVVKRKPNPDDKRGSLFSLTTQARARFPKAKAALVACERRVMHGFAEAEHVALRELLQRVAMNVEDEPADEKRSKTPGTKPSSTKPGSKNKERA